MSYNGDLDKVRKRAEDQGWRYRKTESGHHQFYSPDKETIVTTSGTPGDQRGWMNFLSEMKRGGYLHYEPFGNSLKDALQEAGAVPEPQPTTQPTVIGVEVNTNKGGPTVSAAEHVRSILKHKPNEVFHIDDVHNKVKAVMPKASRQAVAQALKGEVDAKRAHRTGDNPRSGMYKFGPKPKTERAVAKEVVPVGKVTGDKDLDKELKILDEALAALGRLAEVINHIREQQHALAQIKKLLGS